MIDKVAETSVESSWLAADDPPEPELADAPPDAPALSDFVGAELLEVVPVAFEVRLGLGAGATDVLEAVTATDLLGVELNVPEVGCGAETEGKMEPILLIAPPRSTASSN